MGMSDPVPQFSHLVRSLREMHPDLAFLHMIEPGIAGSGDATNTRAHVRESNDIFREIWAPRPFITAGAFTRTAAIAHADERGDLVAFGRLFIANVRSSTYYSGWCLLYVFSPTFHCVSSTTFP